MMFQIERGLSEEAFFWNHLLPGSLDNVCRRKYFNRYAAISLKQVFVFVLFFVPIPSLTLYRVAHAPCDTEIGECEGGGERVAGMMGVSGDSLRESD